MKKYLFFAAALLFLGACANNSEKTTQTSEPQADTIPQAMDAEAPAEEAAAAPEEATEPPKALTITDFCKWDKEDKVMNSKDARKVIAYLKEIGFEETGNRLIDKGIDDCSGEKYKEYAVSLLRGEGLEEYVVNLKYTQNRYGEWLHDIEIVFPDQELTSDFVKTATSNHYKFVRGNLYSAHPEDVYWTGSELEVKGHKVEIHDLSEC